MLCSSKVTHISLSTQIINITLGDECEYVWNTLGIVNVSWVGQYLESVTAYKMYCMCTQYNAYWLTDSWYHNANGKAIRLKARVARENFHYLYPRKCFFGQELLFFRQKVGQLRKLTNTTDLTKFNYCDFLSSARKIVYILPEKIILGAAAP